MVLIPGIILNYPFVSLWILAIFTNVTAIQRFIYVRHQAKIMDQQEKNMDEV
jgi:phosphatidylglycerophosphate synthase